MNDGVLRFEHEVSTFASADDLEILVKSQDQGEPRYKTSETLYTIMMK